MVESFRKRFAQLDIEYDNNIHIKHISESVSLVYKWFRMQNSKLLAHICTGTTIGIRIAATGTIDTKPTNRTDSN